MILRLILTTVTLLGGMQLAAQPIFDFELVEKCAHDTVTGTYTSFVDLQLNTTGNQRFVSLGFYTADNAEFIPSLTSVISMGFCSATTTTTPADLIGQNECWQAVDSLTFCDYSVRVSTNLISINTTIGSLPLNYPYSPGNSTDSIRLVDDIITTLENIGYQYDTVFYDGSFLVVNGSELQIQTIDRINSNGTAENLPVAVNNCENGGERTRNFDVYRNQTGEISLVINGAGDVIDLPADAYRVPCCSVCESEEVTENGGPCKTLGITRQAILEGPAGTVDYGHHAYHSISLFVETGTMTLTVVQLDGTSDVRTYNEGTSITWKHPDPCKYITTRHLISSTEGRTLVTIFR